MIIEDNKGRTCRFNGVFLIADFDITPETLAPFADEIQEKVGVLKPRLERGDFDKIEVGIYKGEVRAWGVTGG